MKKCPYCGRDNENDAKNCSHCFAGLPVEQPKTAEKPEKVAKKSNKE